MQAALASYPELGCTGGPYKVWTKWGISENVLCAGNPKTLQFLDDVFNEIIEMFPSTYIHIGATNALRPSGSIVLNARHLFKSKT